MNEQTKKYLIFAVTALLLAKGLYTNPKFWILLIFPAFIFCVIHHLILQKILQQPFPVSNLIESNKLTKAGKTTFAYGILTLSSLLILIIFGVLSTAGLIPLELRQTLGNLSAPLGKAADALFLIIVMTTILLLFSKKFFTKPIKETWKAILLAGIIAGAATLTLTYGLEKFVGPYLPIRASRVQPTTE